MPKKTKSLTPKMKKKMGSKSATKMSLSDPEKADRSLTLGSGKQFNLEAGKEKHEVELTSSEAKELKEKYPYLELN